MRLYLPTTLADLATHLADGVVPMPPDPIVAAGEGEEAEYDALMEAAEVSATLLTGPGRRVVLVAEVAEGAEGAEVVPWDRVVSAHCDLEDRATDADPDEDLGWFAAQEIPFLV